jgi:hypothetical protein
MRIDERVMIRLLFAAMIAALMSSVLASAAEAQAEKADLALVLAVDVSGSVTEERYALQMEGIARAFEDPAVQAAILSGPHRAIFATLVEWSDRASDVVPWTLIASADDALAFAASIRRAPRADDQFTCMAAALNVIGGKILPFLPAPAQRTIVDVSGDGHDNCNPATKVDTVRDALVATGVTINGLPILEGDEAKTLESWYRDHVVGGPGAFLAPALGFKDFGRAMRRKFLVEISSASPGG